MIAESMLALQPLAFGHDQDASACPWAQLTRRTAEYPSRRAQLAIALMAHNLPPTPDLVSLLYRCDDCSLCRVWSSLPQPPKLERALWSVRAWLAEQEAVPELNPLRAQLKKHGHLYGDLHVAWAALGSGDVDAQTLFVPDGAVLALDLEAASAALWAARRIAGSVALLSTIPDSGRVLRELGLASEAERAEVAVRQEIEQSGFQQVLAGTPKEAAALIEVLDGLPARVTYIGTALAQAVLDNQVQLPNKIEKGRRIVLHASASLLHRLPDYNLLEQCLSYWLSDSFCPEPDARRLAWPAAVERPAIGLDPALAHRLAQRRMDSLLALDPDLVLTCDPLSRRALRLVAPRGVEVRDLLTFVMTETVEA